MTNDQTPPAGSVGPTRLSMLAAVLLVGATLGYALVPLVELRSDPAPRIEWPTVAVLAMIAATLFALAYSTYRTVHRERASMNPRRAVALLALAKASSLVGAMVAGGYLGFGVHFISRLDVELPRERALRALVAAGAALAIMISALLLERACRVPQDPEDQSREA